MIAIPFPPAPQWAAVILMIAAGSSLVLGILLLTWGNFLGRAILTLLGLLGGVGMAQQLCPSDSEAWLVWWIFGGLIGGLFGLICPRFIWALLGAAVCGWAGMELVLWRYAGQIASEAMPAFHFDGETLLSWLEGFLHYRSDLLQVIVKVDPLPAWIIISSSFVIPMCWLGAAPRFARISVSVFVGAAGIIAGVVLGLVVADPQLWDRMIQRWYILASVLGMLCLFGWFIQYRMIVLAKRKKEQEEKEDEEDEDAPPKKSSGKKKKK
jgi:hypothetical protein